MNDYLCHITDVSFAIHQLGWFWQLMLSYFKWFLIFFDTLFSSFLCRHLQMWFWRTTANEQEKKPSFIQFSVDLIPVSDNFDVFVCENVCLCVYGLVNSPT